MKSPILFFNILLFSNLVFGYSAPILSPGERLIWNRDLNQQLLHRSTWKVQLICHIRHATWSETGAALINERIAEFTTLPFTPVPFLSEENLMINSKLPKPFDIYSAFSILAYGGNDGEKMGYMLQNRIERGDPIQYADIELGELSLMKKGATVKNRLDYWIEPNRDLLMFICGLEVLED